MNQLLHTDSTEMINELEQLTHEPWSIGIPDLITAPRVICKQEYEYYKAARKKAETNLQLGQVANGSFVVTDIDPAIAPVMFYFLR